MEIDKSDEMEKLLHSFYSADMTSRLKNMNLTYQYIWRSAEQVPPTGQNQDEVQAILDQSTLEQKIDDVARALYYEYNGFNNKWQMANSMPEMPALAACVDTLDIFPGQPDHIPIPTGRGLLANAEHVSPIWAPSLSVQTFEWTSMTDWNTRSPSTSGYGSGSKSSANAEPGEVSLAPGEITLSPGEVTPDFSSPPPLMIDVFDGVIQCNHWNCDHGSRCGRYGCQQEVVVPPTADKWYANKAPPTYYPPQRSRVMGVSSVRSTGSNVRAAEQQMDFSVPPPHYLLTTVTGSRPIIGRNGNTGNRRDRGGQFVDLNNNRAPVDLNNNNDYMSRDLDMNYQSCKRYPGHISTSIPGVGPLPTTGPAYYPRAPTMRKVSTRVVSN